MANRHTKKNKKEKDDNDNSKKEHTHRQHWTESKIKKNIIGQMLISMFRFDVFVAVAVVVYGIVPLVLSLDSIIFLYFALAPVLIPIFVLCLLAVYIC